MTEYLFSYGTLKKEAVQLQLFGKRLTGNPDVLAGYRTMEIEITDPSFLSGGESKSQLTLLYTGNADDRVKGTALELSTEELLKADAYEPSNYKRMAVTLESGKQAWIYRAV